MTKKWQSAWKGILWDGNLKPHWAWYASGRKGDGRIVMADENLQGAAVASLAGARFERCDFSGANFYLGGMEDIEVVECSFDEGAMQGSGWDRAHITGCRAHGAWLSSATFGDAVIHEGDWLGAYLERTAWTRARATSVSLRATTLTDSRFDGGVFTDCDFSCANLSRREYDLDLATAHGTRFVRCDFTNANFDGLRLDRTVFEQCKFADVVGKPALEGPCELIEPDFTHTREPDIRSQDEVLAMWREGTAAEIATWSRYGRTASDASRTIGSEGKGGE